MFSVQDSILLYSDSRNKTQLIGSLANRLNLEHREYLYCTHELLAQRARPHLSERLRTDYPRMRLSRIIEISFTILIAFIIICVISFLTLRPSIQSIRSEVKDDWESFEKAVQERNLALPGLIEALRGFETGHSKLVEKLTEARSVSMIPGSPDRFVAAVDDMDRQLEQIDQLSRTSPELSQYPPFAVHWNRVKGKSMGVRITRAKYNSGVRLYNGLLEAFPQNMISSLFGFVPLSSYPEIRR